VSAADRAALLERAAFQGIRYDERSSPDYQHALVREACALVGAAPERAARFSSNRNADLWTIAAADGPWLLKILTSKPAATLDCEYAQLVALDAIAVTSGAFRVPAPRALFAGRSAYLMRQVAFRPLVARLADRGESTAALRAGVAACGRALSAIHDAWSAGCRPLDAAAVAADFVHLPWAPGARETALLERRIAALAGRPFAHAQLYLDFDPVNVGHADDGTPLLLDPPERYAVDAVQWDLGVFLFGLRRAVWRRPAAARRHAARLGDLRRAFLAWPSTPGSASSGAGGLHRSASGTAPSGWPGPPWPGRCCGRHGAVWSRNSSARHNERWSNRPLRSTWSTCSRRRSAARASTSTTW
jgi:hypothetical protein